MTVDQLIEILKNVGADVEVLCIDTRSGVIEPVSILGRSCTYVAEYGDALQPGTQFLPIYLG